MDKKLLHLGLNLGPFTPNPHTLPSELSGTMKIFEGNDVYIQILNSDYLSTSPHFQKSDSVGWKHLPYLSLRYEFNRIYIFLFMNTKHF